MVWASGRKMLRIRINILLAVVLAPGGWACAPRSTPAPVIMGGAGAVSPAYPAPANGQGHVVVQPGDTLYAISRYHQTALQALIEANDLAPPFIIKPGQVLRLPEQGLQSHQSPTPILSPRGGGEQIVETQRINPSVAGVQAKQIEKKQPDASVAVNPPIEVGNDPTPDSGEDQTSGFSMEDEEIPLPPKPAPVRKPIEGQKKTAMIPAAVPAPAPASTPARVFKDMRFLWPAKGPILSDFGPKQNGLHNDGINIAMPPNGPVRAAGDGVVSYAGNGLRGYGNLLLIRHEGGWVTAYAHNAELLVEKGATVARGQVIAKAGRSGGVSQDQLHFEIRQGAKAVDPKPLLVGG